MGTARPEANQEVRLAAPLQDACAPGAATTATGRHTDREVAQPLVALCLALILGIVLDAFFPLPARGWLVCAALAMLPAWGWPNFRMPAVLIALVAIGGGWHHLRTSVFRADDIGGYADEVPHLCRVRGEITTELVSERPDPAEIVGTYVPPERTSFRLEVTYLAVEGPDSTVQWRRASGRLAVRISGAVTQVRRGDSVEILGWLQLPGRTSNPGEIDYRAVWLRQRVRAVFHAKTPETLILLVRPRWSYGPWRDGLRRTASECFANCFDPPDAALAEAILLGKRSLQRHELTLFWESGTLHLLVVSGGHLVVLASMFWLFGNLVGLSLTGRAWLTMVLSLGYAEFTGGESPIVRAAVVIALLMMSFVVQRRPQPLNSLAGAALVVLAIDPTELFRAGTQLSFLAVLSLILFARPLVAYWVWPGLSTQEHPTVWKNGLHYVYRLFGDAFMQSLLLYVTTAPLLAYRFHITTPVCVLLTPLLLPALAVLLWLGPVIVLIYQFFPPLAFPLVFLCRWCLWLLRASVTSSEWLPGAFAYLPNVSAWWVLGFYLLLLLPYCWPGLGRKSPWRGGSRYLAAHFFWLILGFGFALPRAVPQHLEYHQLDVGHGLCSVLRFPSGETILFDCGSLRGPQVTERVIAPWLWAHGISGLSAVFVSHADVDHFNGLAPLARRFRVQRVYVTPQFARSRQAAVDLVHEQLSRLDVPFQLVWAEDQFRIGAAKLRVLHPHPDATTGNDNSNSLVLECRWDQGSLLLTGDLVDEGLQQLLRRSPTRFDVLIAPHHGGFTSNPTALADWARPRLVISSQGERRADPLQTYADTGAIVLRTVDQGAITCRWLPQGLVITTFRGGKHFHLP